MAFWNAFSNINFSMPFLGCGLEMPSAYSPSVGFSPLGGMNGMFSGFNPFGVFAGGAGVSNPFTLPSSYGPGMPMLMNTPSYNLNIGFMPMQNSFGFGGLSMPNFNFGGFSVGDSFSKGNSTGTWKGQTYNKSKAEALAKDAYESSRNVPGQCAGFTRKTLNKIYGTNFGTASAHTFEEKILNGTSPNGVSLKGKFKKYTVPAGTTWADIPDGAICWYKANTPGFTKGKAALYGHVGIKTHGACYSNSPIKSRIPQVIYLPV